MFAAVGLAKVEAWKMGGRNFPAERNGGKECTANV